MLDVTYDLNVVPRDEIVGNDAGGQHCASLEARRDG